VKFLQDAVGKFLKEIRESKKITIEEIAEETKIQKRYLIALEEENFEELPGEAYIKGFLKNYAAALGVAEGEIIKRYNSLKSMKVKEIENKNNEEKEIVHRVERRKVKKINVFLLFFVFFLFLAGIIIFIKQQPEKMEINEIENVQKTAAESEKTAAENNSTELFVEKTSTNESIDVEKSSLNSLKFKFTGSSWIEIKDGDKVVYRGTFYSGKELSIVSKNEIKVVIGNAEAVQISYNNKDLGVLGGKNKRVEKVFK